MPIDFANAAVGTAFSELFTLVKDVVITVAAFRKELQKIASTLSTIDPIIKDIDKYNNRLNRSPKEMAPIKDLLEEGKGLVSDCSKIHAVNVYQIYTHSKKLTKFNTAVVETFQIYMPLVNERTGKETLVEVKDFRGEMQLAVEDVKKILISALSNGLALQSVPVGVDLAVPAAPDFIVGSEVEASLSKLKEQLLEEGVSVIVVTAPGGCGKTTLVKKLCHDVAIAGKFKDNIMFVSVLKKPNLTDIVHKMYQHNGFKAPKIKSEDDAVHCSQQLLKKIGQNPVLLVLDDVWKESEYIIDNFFCNDIKDYKIVVTSRCEFPCFHPVHHLNPLTHDEAVELFRRCFTVDDRSMGAPDTKLLNEMVEHCKRLPLVIRVVAKSLQVQNYAFWRRKLNQLSEGHSLLDLEKEILACLKKSLDDLDGDPSIKKRFMDLASFPEDCKIPATALIDMWLELYKLESDEECAITDLHELVSRNRADLVVTRTLACQNGNEVVENVNVGPSTAVCLDVRGVERSGDNFRLNVPARSVPISPFTSRVRSPQITSLGDLLPCYYSNLEGNNIWSALEKPTGSRSPSFLEHNGLPLPSTQTKTPRRTSKSLCGSASPMHHKSLFENSTAGRERNVQAGVHPLPRPPGAALPSHSPSNAQVTVKTESLPLKSPWEKGRLIGRGTFANVYVARNRETGALCAMKEVELLRVDPKSAECMRQLEQEINVLSWLKHPNIVQYYGSEIVEDRFYVYLEYVHPGSINKYVRDHCGAITESVVRNFTRHILSGLAFLHSKKTTHRDIRGANLLVDASGIVKLADFGMAKHGSPRWMAPELIQAMMQKDNGSDHALAVDIWSLGCTIIEMLTGKPPWSEFEGVAFLFKAMKNSPSIPQSLSSEGKDFLQHCFRRDPGERPSAAMLLEHPFLKIS